MMSNGKVVATGSPTELRESFSGQGAIVRTDSLHADFLERAGLRVTHIAGRAIGTGDPEAVAAAAATLVRASSESSFEIGPPTLEDVYVARVNDPVAEGQS